MVGLIEALDPAGGRGKPLSARDAGVLELSQRARAADRDRFRERLRVDDATWLRARGWCVSQALIALGYYTAESNPPIHAEATRWLAEVLAS